MHGNKLLNDPSASVGRPQIERDRVLFLIPCKQLADRVRILSDRDGRDFAKRSLPTIKHSGVGALKTYFIVQ